MTDHRAPNPPAAREAAQRQTVLPVSLIIPTRNRPDLAFEAVQAVLRGDCLPDEIIVVDHSDEPNRRLAELVPVGPTLNYLWERKRGVSRGRNTGIAAARHDIVAFIDDDVLAEPDWLAVLVRSLTEAGPRAVVAGAALHGEPEAPGRYATALLADRERRSYVGRSREPAVGTINLALHRSAFEAVGGFDERLGPGTRFPAAEDNDLAYRLLKAGYRIDYVPEAAVVHRAWRPGATYRAMRWNYGRGQGAFYAKHLGARDTRTLRWLIQNALRHLSQARRRWPANRRLATGDLAYLGGLLTGAAEWLLGRAAGSR